MLSVGQPEESCVNRAVKGSRYTTGKDLSAVVVVGISSFVLQLQRFYEHECTLCTCAFMYYTAMQMLPVYVYCAECVLKFLGKLLH